MGQAGRLGLGRDGGGLEVGGSGIELGWVVLWGFRAITRTFKQRRQRKRTSCTRAN